MKYGFTFSFFCLFFYAQAQMITGFVYDEVTLDPIAGAKVSVVEQVTGHSANQNGQYHLSSLLPGRYTLSVQFVGYNAKIIPDVYVRNGHITIVDVFMRGNSADIDEEVTVYQRDIPKPDGIHITEENTERFAGTLYDPARLVTTISDVAVIDDRSNLVSVRGVSPFYNTWRLEGVEIANPNHLTAFGTFANQATNTGGALSIFNSRMVDNSKFVYGNSEAEYNNSIGGIYDMHLKRGNNTQRHYWASASLLGFDIGSDGPMSDKESTILYAANYRYSLPGLLSNFGLDYQGETIGFQDASVSLTIPLGDSTKLTVFGVGGLSFNDTDVRPLQDSEFADDRFSRTYSNETGAAGVRIARPFNESHLSVTGAISGYNNTIRETEYSIAGDVVEAESTYKSNSRVLSIRPEYIRNLGLIRWTTGAFINDYRYTLDTARARQLGVDNAEIELDNFEIYMEVQRMFAQKIGVSAGLVYNYTDQSSSFDPRINLEYLVNGTSSIFLGAGAYSQMLNPFNVDLSDPYYTEKWGQNRFGLIYTYRGSLGYVTTGPTAKWESELFGQYFDRVVRGTSPTGNELQTWIYGASTTFEKYMVNNAYIRLGGTYFQSDDTGVLANSHWNTNYSARIATGRKFDFSNIEKNRELLFNVRGLYQGGKVYTNGELVSGNRAPRLGEFTTDPFWRIDVKLMWTRYYENATTTISLDVQNVTNTKNEAYRYADIFTGNVERVNQYGILPFLSYRVEW